MTSSRFTLALATASLALGFAVAPVSFHADSGLKGMTAVAKEAKSGGRHSEAGDDKGGDQGGKGGHDDGGRTGDDHPGSHDRNGKDK